MTITTRSRGIKIEEFYPSAENTEALNEARQKLLSGNEMKLLVYFADNGAVAGGRAFKFASQFPKSLCIQSTGYNSACVWICIQRVTGVSGVRNDAGTKRVNRLVDALIEAVVY